MARAHVVPFGACGTIFKSVSFYNPKKKKRSRAFPNPVILQHNSHALDPIFLGTLNDSALTETHFSAGERLSGQKSLVVQIQQIAIVCSSIDR